MPELTKTIFLHDMMPREGVGDFYAKVEHCIWGLTREEYLAEFSRRKLRQRYPPYAPPETSPAVPGQPLANYRDRRQPPVTWWRHQMPGLPFPGWEWKQVTYDFSAVWDTSHDSDEGVSPREQTYRLEEHMPRIFEVGVMAHARQRLLDAYDLPTAMTNWADAVRTEPLWIRREGFQRAFGFPTATRLWLRTPRPLPSPSDLSIPCPLRALPEVEQMRIGEEWAATRPEHAVRWFYRLGRTRQAY